MKLIFKASALLFISLFFVQCSKKCGKGGRCEMIPDPGNCFAAIPKYYFDQEEKKCKTFVWGGCGGTVPYDSMEDCEKDCGCN